VITIFCLVVFSQLSFEFSFLIEEDQVKLTHFFQFILENLSLCHSLYCHLQELVLIPREFYQRLCRERVKIGTRGCSKVNCQSTYINLFRSSL
jgi:hypothetical protein